MYFHPGDRVQFSWITMRLATGTVNHFGTMRDDHGDECVDILIYREPMLVHRSADDCRLISRKQTRRRPVEIITIDITI